MWKMECEMTFFGTTMNKVVRMHHLHKIKVQMKDHWTTFWLNKKGTNECSCSENFKFPFHSGICSITFHFKCVIYFAILFVVFLKPSCKNWMRLKLEVIWYLQPFNFLHHILSYIKSFNVGLQMASHIILHLNRTPP